MSRKKHCKYCHGKTNNTNGICAFCTEKLELIRKIRAIVFAIKKDAEGGNAHDEAGAAQ